MFPFSWFKRRDDESKLIDDPQWKEDCRDYHGRELTGKRAHYCDDFDGMPIDETCREIRGCSCDWPESN